MNYGRRVGKCCLSAFKIATKSNHKSRLQHIFLIYIQIMTGAVSLGVIIYASGGLSQNGKGIEQNHQR